MNRLARISEIFQSIQGEGPYAGFRQVFVRFYGCHMHCAWCDTPESIGDKPGKYREMSVRQVLDRIKTLWPACHSVSLTGGEPLLQADFIAELLPLLKKAKMPVYLETSGVLHEALGQVIKGVDIVSMDFKLPSSTGQRSFWKEHEQFLGLACKSGKEVFVKIVISHKTKRSEVIRAAQIVKKISPDISFIIQPNTFDLKKGMMEQCGILQKECFKILKDVRVMPQMHKFLKIR